MQANNNVSPTSTIALTPSQATVPFWNQLPPSSPLTSSGNLPWQPAVELTEARGKLYVQMQLPGFLREEIEIQVTPTDVIVAGANFASTGLSQRCVLASEFHYGPFERKIRLPVPIAPQSTQAELNHGLLTLAFSKARASEARTAVEKVWLGEAGSQLSADD